MDTDPQNPPPGIQPGPAGPPPPPPPVGETVTPGLPPPPVGHTYQAQPNYTSRSPQTTRDSDRLYVAILHLSPILAGALASTIGMPFLNFLAPLVMWLVKKEQSAFIDDQGKESLNFNITMGIAALLLTIIGVIFTFITLGLGMFIVVPLAFIFAIAFIAVCVIAAIKSYNGEYYRYPFTYRFIK